MLSREQNISLLRSEGSLSGSRCYIHLVPTGLRGEETLVSFVARNFRDSTLEGGRSFCVGHVCSTCIISSCTSPLLAITGGE